MTQEAIEVRGARVNNLKNISFSIPINQMTVVTGVSGSGKSSLAFDTIYAEGQRRYVESLSAYARQFLERMDKPDVDEVRGIAPAIAIRQKNSTRNPRSTVSTQTEIYDYLRLLYARVGSTICRVCGREVHRDSPESAADEILAELAEGTRFYVLFPAAAGLQTQFNEVAAETRKNGAAATAGKKKSTRQRASTSARHLITAHLMSLMQRGFTRLLVDGTQIDLASPDDYARDDFANVCVLVDRLVARPDVRQRLVDSLETCFREGHGQAMIETSEPPAMSGGRSSPAHKFLRFSERFECKYDGTVYATPEPRLFSFNNPYGACPTCQGFGNTIGLDLDLVIPNPGLSLAEGAIEPWTKPQYEWAQAELKRFGKAERIPMNVPFNQLTRQQRNAVINGKGEWRGVRGFFDWLDTKKYKLHVRVFLSKYRGYTRCPDCDGSRLRQEARDVRVGGRTLPEVSALSIKDAAMFFEALELSTEQSAIAERVLFEVRRRLKFLVEVGLDYLTLDRLASTLSGGEAQRIQLATNLGSSLVGALYVLDEPSIGLHPRDNDRLIALLHNLRDIGNTVLVVEHDAEMIRSADHILDIGPYAGELGGRLFYEGDFAGLYREPQSLTGRYFRGEAEIKEPKQRRALQQRRLTLRHASEHNLKSIDVDVPLDMLVCVTGVSGSGKSTLVHDVLYRALEQRLTGEHSAKRHLGEAVGSYGELTGTEVLDAVVLIDQDPIGRSPRSNPVTYVKAFDEIRRIFASTPLARQRGYSAGTFSFNVAGGRCEACEGAGYVEVEMVFMADVFVPCDHCGGKRFKQDVLEVTVGGRNINDVLQLTVDQAIRAFPREEKLATALWQLQQVGLGYLRLGQPATTLSGGEAQRIKIARELAQSGRSSGRKLYVMDEPTTGLHLEDIRKLAGVLDRLVDAGHTLVLIEHNLDVIKLADWVIDLGPDAGVNGGRLVAMGRPEEVAAVEGSHTGQWLRTVLPTWGADAPPPRAEPTEPRSTRGPRLKARAS